MNKTTGIVFGAVMLVIISAVLLNVFVFKSPDAPTRATTRSGKLKLIEMDRPITDVIGAQPSDSGSDGGAYATAMEVYVANEKAIFEAAAALTAGDLKGDSHAPQALKALEEIRGHLATAARQGKMEFLAKRASGTFVVSQSQTDIRQMGLTVDMLDTLADYYIQNNRLDDANATLEVMLLAGWRMVQARSHIHMVTYGADIQKSALKGMSRALVKAADQDEARKRRNTLQEYSNSLTEFKERYIDKSEIFGQNPFNAGDIWNIAENDEDRAWRVQAILAMGLIKFSHLSKANQSYNNSLIEKFLKSSDPLEKAAAEAAKAYTEIDFNQAGTTW